MVHDVSRRVPGMPKKVWSIVARERIRSQQIRKSVESRGQEALFINVCEGAQRAAVSDSQKIKIFGMLPIFREKRNSVQTRTVMVQLTFNLPKLAREYKIPVPACAAVVSPMRNCRIVAKDGVQRHVRLLFKAKVFHPGVDLFLPGRVPRHLSPTAIRFLFPSIGAHAHSCFPVIPLG